MTWLHTTLSVEDREVKAHPDPLKEKVVIYPLLLLLAAHPRRRCRAVPAGSIFALAVGFIVVVMLLGQTTGPVAAGLLLVLLAVTLGLTATER